MLKNLQFYRNENRREHNRETIELSVRHQIVLIQKCIPHKE
jgi:hypothetical protein